jgi:hypothetical protein
MIYAFFDGDNIGDKLEILLLEGKIAEAQDFSHNIETAIDEIKIKLKSNPDVEIIIAGGDDLLIGYDPAMHNDLFLEELRSIFKARTNHSMSCGIGESIPQAVRNLYLAKLYGKNRIRDL